MAKYSALFHICFLLSLVLCAYGETGITNRKQPAASDVKVYCVAIPGLPNTRQLQESIERNCKVIDCVAILKGNPCYEPNTVLSHASYVLNLVYQKLGYCNTDIGVVTLTNPSYGKCVYPAEGK